MKINGLKPLAPHGFNTKIGDYTKEMYNLYNFSDQLCQFFRYYVQTLMKNMTELGLD